MSYQGSRRALGALLLAVSAMASSLPASAHHSFAIYDRSKTLSLTGTVKTFQWTNPHCVIVLVTQPEGGAEPQEWSIETTSPGVLTRSGWTRTSVKAGDHVTVVFNPLHDGSRGGGLNTVTLLDTGLKLEANYASGDKPGIK